jgi:hypothetical protein
MRRVTDELTPNHYLEAILRDHTLAQDGPELKQLRKIRDKIRQILRWKYGETPTLNEGGSKRKGTMIRDSYDLDLFCFFPEGDTTAGSSLQDIFEGVWETLSEEYFVEKGRSALKVHTLEQVDGETAMGPYLHVDVVPGRYIHDESGDVNLHQNEGAKRSLKTNPEVQVDHIRNSGVRPAIRLAKLWNHRWGLSVKTFVLELLVVKVLKPHAKEPLPDQMVRLWETLRDEADSIVVKDPANPEGNDLSERLDSLTRGRVQQGARRALDAIENLGWEEVFGPVEERSSQEKAAALGAVAAHIGSNRPTRPYFDRSDGSPLV